MNWHYEALTNLKNTAHSSLVQEPQSLAEWRVLVLHGVGGAATGTAVHPNVPLIAREGPEDQSLLDRLGYPGKPLLNPLEGDSLGHKLGGNVEEGAGGVSPLCSGPMTMGTMSLVTMATGAIPSTRHSQQ